MQLFVNMNYIYENLRYNDALGVLDFCNLPLINNEIAILATDENIALVGSK